MIIATKIEKNILPCLLKFARFQPLDKENDDNRGRFLFSPIVSSNKLDNESKGINFFKKYGFLNSKNKSN